MDKKGKLKVADIMNKYGEKCNKCSLVSWKWICQMMTWYFNIFQTNIRKVNHSFG